METLAWYNYERTLVVHTPDGGEASVYAWRPGRPNSLPSEIRDRALDGTLLVNAYQDSVDKLLSDAGELVRMQGEPSLRADRNAATREYFEAMPDGFKATFSATRNGTTLFSGVAGGIERSGETGTWRRHNPEDFRTEDVEVFWPTEDNVGYAPEAEDIIHAATGEGTLELRFPSLPAQYFTSDNSPTPGSSLLYFMFCRMLSVIRD